MAVWSTNVVNVFDCLVRCFENAVKELHLVHDSVWAALLRSTVISMDHKDCVVELSDFAQAFNQAANLVIRMIKERCKSFLQSCSKALFVI